MQDNEKFYLDDLSLQIIETPGHTSDHISFGVKSEQEREDVLFPGDAILGSQSVNFQFLILMYIGIFGEHDWVYGITKEVVINEIW